MDTRDTIVDPPMRREVEPAKPDLRRPLLLIAIVGTAVLAGALAMAMWFASSRAAPAPAQVPAPAQAPAQLAPPAATPVPTEAALPAPTARPRCPSYGHKGEGAEQPASADCIP